jgi:hypothetical protein
VGVEDGAGYFGAVDIEMTLPDLGDSVVEVAVVANSPYAPGREAELFQHALSAGSACLSAIILPDKCVRKAVCTCIRSAQMLRRLPSGDTLVLFRCGRSPP